MSITVATGGNQIAVSVGETAIDVSVAGGVGPTGPAGPPGAGGVTSLQGLTGALTLAAVGGSWATSGSTITLTVAAASVDWDSVTGKPSTFTPSSHTHSWSDITSGVPSTFTPSAHNQAWSTITSTPTTLSGYGITDAVASSDARLTDARTPTAHKASHATGGTDALSPADIGAAVDDHTHAASNITSGTFTATLLPLATTTVRGAVIVGTGLSVASGTVSVSYGTASGTACQGDDSRLTDARTPTSHTHGNITNAGAIGTTSGLPVKTGASGVLEVGAFGTSAGQFAEGNHTHSQLHDRSHAITSTSDHTATAWRVFYSNGFGNVTELALGSSGQVLTSGGASAAPSWATPSGGGSSSASDLTSGTLADARLSSKALAAVNLSLWSLFR